MLISHLWNSYQDAVNLTNEEGQTAAHVAAAAGKVEYLKLLVQYGVKLDIIDSQSWTPLVCFFLVRLKCICILNACNA